MKMQVTKCNTCIKHAQMVNYRLNVLLINHNQIDLYIHSKAVQLIEFD